MARNPLTPFRSGSLLGGDPLLLLHREMNRLFDDTLRGTGASAGSEGAAGALLAPQINVSETDKAIRVSAEMPGVSEHDVHVDLHDDVLVIRGEKKLERKEERERFHFVERSHGTFQRAIQLPYPVDPGQVQASFNNGVLDVVLPKTAQQERSHRIQIRSGESASRQQASGTGAAATGPGNGGQAGKPASSGASDQGGASGGGSKSPNI